MEADIRLQSDVKFDVLRVSIFGTLSAQIQVTLAIICVTLLTVTIKRLRWSRVQTRPKPSDFSRRKKSSSCLPT